jgi:Tfp pilus assembly protein PilX
MGNGTAPITCGAAVTAPVGQICDTKLADPTNVPWKAAGAETGVIYAPPDMTVSTTVAAGTYYKSPSFYIAQVGLSPDGKTTVYQIDAVGYGGRPDAVAVVESTYKVQVGDIDRGGL